MSTRPKLPSVNVPVVNGDGTMQKDWYRYFSIGEHIGAPATAAAAGAATALPGAPELYITVTVNGADYLAPLWLIP